MERKKKNLLPITLLMIPMKDSQGANDGGKMCLYNGPTHSSSIVTIPLVSRYGKWYLYLSKSYMHKITMALKLKWKV
jgi:hypothetical protein